jgi:uncharacterized protein DUF3574
MPMPTSVRTPTWTVQGRTLAAFGLALAIVSDAGAQPLACRGLQKPQQVAELLFGRKIGDRVAVSERQWERFVAREITPKFPDGLTVIDTKGQYRDAARNAIVREPSKLVVIVLSGDEQDEARLAEIAEAYKRRFRQQSVGIIVRGACVSF